MVKECQTDLPRRSSAQCREDTEMLRLGVVLCLLCFPSPQSVPCPNRLWFDTPSQTRAGHTAQSHCGALSASQALPDTASSSSSSPAESKKPSLLQPHPSNQVQGSNSHPCVTSCLYPNPQQVLALAGALLDLNSGQVRLCATCPSASISYLGPTNHPPVPSQVHVMSQKYSGC